MALVGWQAVNLGQLHGAQPRLVNLGGELPISAKGNTPFLDRAAMRTMLGGPLFPPSNSDDGGFLNRAT